MRNIADPEFSVFFSWKKLDKNLALIIRADLVPITQEHVCVYSFTSALVGRMNESSSVVSKIRDHSLAESFFNILSREKTAPDRLKARAGIYFRQKILTKSEK